MTTTLHPFSPFRPRWPRLLPALLLASAAAACGGSPAASDPAATPSPGSEEEAIAVQVAPVRREPISAIYSTSATLRSDRRATVIARTRGVVRRLEVEEGDRVAADAPLALLEDEEQRLAAERARLAYDAARRELERLQGLFGQGLVSEDSFEKARQTSDETSNALEVAELALSRTTIRAPFAGVILKRFLDVGATVSDGTAVFELADLDPLFADVNVPERQVDRLRPGQDVLLSTDEESGTARARIERIAPSVDTATGTVKVTIAVEGGEHLRPGGFVRVDIVTDTHPEALVVPRSALVAEGHRWNLYRLDSDRTTVHQLEARLGFENGDRVEIAGLAGDGPPLTEGDRVVAVGAPALSDGARVRLVEPPLPAAPTGQSGTDAS